MIHLVGPGAAGKTTVGFALATRLGIPFVDLDEQSFVPGSASTGACLRGSSKPWRPSTRSWRVS